MRDLPTIAPKTDLELLRDAQSMLKKVLPLLDNEHGWKDDIRAVLAELDQRLAAGTEVRSKHSNTSPPCACVGHPFECYKHPNGCGCDKALAPVEREPNGFRERMSFEKRMADQFTPPSAPQAEGWQLVPKHATHDMMCEAVAATNGKLSMQRACNVYERMLAAAPPSPPSGWRPTDPACADCGKPMSVHDDSCPDRECQRFTPQHERKDR